MTELPENENGTKGDEPEEMVMGGNSVLEFLQSKTGDDVPRVTLYEQDSAAASPLINPSSQEKLSIPQGRGTYQLMGEIARGGMGVILKGHDTDLGRDVAVKVLDKRLCERMDVVQRFVEEAQIGGQLQHPGIVPVYELGLMADERPYFTMKLIKGRTLATLLAERDGPKDQRRHLIDVFESICQTMAYAHSRSVIHRDLKPANIMVGAFGEVQVVDWGLAKVLLRGGTADEKRARRRQSTQLTLLETVRSGSEGSGSGSESMVGSVMGTPAYMPPEQASGLVDRLDERADVFALGAILCEILTGLPPYVGDRDKIISDAAQAELEPAYKRLDECGADPELIKLTKHCLTPASAARPANAGLVAERVHQHVVSVDERAHTAQVEAAEARVRVEQERKARRLTVALGVAVLGLGVVGGGGWLWVQNERAMQERAEAERMRAAAARDSELRTEVNEAMNTAAVFEGAEQWTEAVAAGERARALAQGGGASEELMASIDGLLARVRSGQEVSERRQRLAQDNADLLAELDAIQPEQDLRDTVDLRARAQQYDDTFRDHGIDLSEGSPQDAADLIRGRGLGSEVALVLDAWADLRRSSFDDDGAARLVEIAQLVDPDSLRGHLRQALANRQHEELYLLAESDLAGQPPETIALLSTSLIRIRDREAAEQLLRSAIERYPDNFSLLYGLGRSLTPAELDNGVRSKLEDAAECYRGALALDPHNESVRYHLGRVYSKMNEPRRALDQFEAALDIKPGTPNYRFHQAKENLALGNLDVAAEIIVDLLDLEDPFWIGPWSHNMYAEILYAQGDVERALEYSEIAVEMRPQNERFDMTLLTVAEAIGSEDLLLDVSRRSAERFPDNSNALNNLAWSLALSAPDDPEVLDEALRLVERSIELGGAEATSLNTLGVIQYYLGQYESSLATIHQADALEPHPANWVFLAMAHTKLEQPELAKIWYDRTLEWERINGPGDPETARFFGEMKAVVTRD